MWFIDFLDEKVVHCKMDGSIANGTEDLKLPSFSKILLLGK